MCRWQSTTPICFTKAACFWCGKALVSRSAGTGLVSFQVTIRLFRRVSWRSQCCWMPICFNLVWMMGLRRVTSETVCALSQCITKRSSRSNFNWSKKRFQAYNSFAADVKDKSSASVVEVDTVDRRRLLQSIAPPNSWTTNASVLFLDYTSSANAASLAALKTVLAWVGDVSEYRMP